MKNICFTDEQKLLIVDKLSVFCDDIKFNDLCIEEYGDIVNLPMEEFEKWLDEIVFDIMKQALESVSEDDRKIIGEHLITEEDFINIAYGVDCDRTR